MSTTRSLEERVYDKQAQLEKLLEKAKQYQAQIKQLESRKADEDRKKRTHRLIEVGASVEAVLGREIHSEDLPSLIKFLQNLESNGHLFSEAMSTISPYEILDDEV